MFVLQTITEFQNTVQSLKVKLSSRHTLHFTSMREFSCWVLLLSIGNIDLSSLVTQADDHIFCGQPH
ncbi:uncharacterized protein BJ212DRAFT_1374552 [Suillus subaureus]|uniref:Uncharacterized protein n=1 Tax=Suillus subaureus TaxID=48587 RepID=A0A9P7E5A4_9AGAM|nr:uncharacterized protein BJ212DRAFT_1374552 [Suillus subaureus]KAG1811437.1 hypothetical protein BJ212DRAFT_1374552 [Suillus subaureus]